MGTGGRCSASFIACFSRDLITLVLKPTKCWSPGVIKCVRANQLRFRNKCRMQELNRHYDLPRTVFPWCVGSHLRCPVALETQEMVRETSAGLV